MDAHSKITLPVSDKLLFIASWQAALRVVCSLADVALHRMVYAIKRYMFCSFGPSVYLKQQSSNHSIQLKPSTRQLHKPHA